MPPQTVSVIRISTGFPEVEDDVEEAGTGTASTLAGGARPEAARGGVAEGADSEATELMQRVGQGDVRAFERLVDRFWEPTVIYARHLTGDPEQAFDVAQEAFTRLWERRTRWVVSGSVRVWLLRTSRNLIISDQRKWKVRKLWATRGGETGARRPSTPLEDTETRELRAAIDRNVRALSPRRREAFTLFHLQGLSYQEVAEIMEVRPQTVANYLQAALADLRVSLAGFFPAAAPADRRPAKQIRPVQ